MQTGSTYNRDRQYGTLARSGSVSYFVFFHDQAKLDTVAGDVSCDPRFNFVDLNLLPIPDYLRIPNLNEFHNRAVLSEYLGLLSISPSTEMLGLFTYSIPLKFSARWAALTGMPEIFLPELTFARIAAGIYEPANLYAAEIKNPIDPFAEEIVRSGIVRIHERFRVGSARLSDGPYKASFVVSGERYREFVEWFREVCAWLLGNVDLRAGAGSNSPFSASSYANKTDEEKRTDRIRHGLGGLLERIVAYYFAQSFPDDRKIRLGEHLAQARS